MVTPVSSAVASANQAAAAGPCESRKDAPDSSLRKKRSKRPHQKSRLGCLTCKKRRVKCDEQRPLCRQCLQLGAPCCYTIPLNGPGADASGQQRPDEGCHTAMEISRSGLQRKPGRPKKDWATFMKLPRSSIAPPGPPSIPDLFSHPMVSKGESETRQGSIIVSQAHLLYHFTTSSGPSLVGTKNAKHPTVLFWQRDAPQLAFAHPFLLQMVLALAMFHIGRLQLHRSDAKASAAYIQSARQHLSTGIGMMNAALGSINDANCGALLISSMLLCSCTFANGPMSPQDLLLCQVDAFETTGGILPLIRGFQLVQCSVATRSLYIGGLKRLAPGCSNSFDDARPLCLSMGLPRIEWSTHLDGLHDLVAADTSPNALIYHRAFNIVRKIYEAVYGREDGSMDCSPSYKITLIFLYLAEPAFGSCIRACRPLALLILAYYAPLLKSDANAWYLHDWALHLVHAVQRLLEDQFKEMMRWPLDSVQA